MPEISVRGLEMPESPIRKLAPLAAAAKNRGIKVYHLNIGQPDLPTPQVGLDALKNITVLFLSILLRKDIFHTDRSWWDIIRNTTSMFLPTISSSPQVVPRLCSLLS